MSPLMSDMNSSADTVSVEVMLAMPQVQYRLALDVPQGTCVREAVRLALEAGFLPVGADIDINPLTAPLGVFAEKVEDNYCCQAGDRVEIYRPLLQDPMELRRQRARQSIS